MPLPPLDNRGLLPAGIHETNWASIEYAFLNNVHRQELFAKAMCFFHGELSDAGAGLQLILGGSFFSDKSLPEDIEATIYAPFSESYRKLAQLSNIDAHNRIKQTYGVDFYVSWDAGGSNDFRLFFQYVGPKTAHQKGLNEHDLRGIVKVIEWQHG